MKILVTGGPTREYLDRVRFLSNPSTGIMGDAIAREAQARGHTVTLVRGPSSVRPPEEVRSMLVETTEEMRQACFAVWPQCDAVIMAANPCDYRPHERHPGKIKRLAGEKVILTLVRTPDILFELGQARRPDQRMVGFSVDVDNPEQNGLQKLERKNLDLVVVSPPESLGHDRGATATIFGRGSGRVAELRGSKRDIARGIIEALERLPAAAPRVG